MEAMKADVTLDCRGTLCPMPVIRVSQAIKKIAMGQVIEMLTTDPGSVPDMQAWSKQTGHELMNRNEREGVYTFHIRRTQ
ncbi:MAG: sulfurtransferase TusA family protein [Candidatus Methylomirabilota bacterium]